MSHPGMSDTPRVDEMEVDNSEFADWGSGPSGFVRVDDARALERELAALRAEVKRFRSQRDNLLARIHRDGGHYLAEHGEAKALQEADMIVAETYAEVERLRADAEGAYDAGWCKCAEWAERDDLKADVGSPAYVKDRDAAIDAVRTAERKDSK